MAGPLFRYLEGAPAWIGEGGLRRKANQPAPPSPPFSQSHKRVDVTRECHKGDQGRSARQCPQNLDTDNLRLTNSQVRLEHPTLYPIFGLNRAHILARTATPFAPATSPQSPNVTRVGTPRPLPPGMLKNRGNKTAVEQFGQGVAGWNSSARTLLDAIVAD